METVSRFRRKRKDEESKQLAGLNEAAIAAGAARWRDVQMFGREVSRDLPDFEALKDAGLMAADVPPMERAPALEKGDVGASLQRPEGARDRVA